MSGRGRLGRVLAGGLVLTSLAGCYVGYPKGEDIPEPRRPASAPGERRLVAPETVAGFTKVTGSKPPRVELGPGTTINAYYRRPGIEPDDTDDFSRVLAAEVEGGAAQTERAKERMLDLVGGGLIGETGRKEPGPLGGISSCGFIGVPEDGDVVCAWSDADTAGVITLPGAANTEAGLANVVPLFVAMRHDLVR